MTREDQFIGQLEAYLDEYGEPARCDSRRRPRRASSHEAGRPERGLARVSGMSNAYKVGIAAAVIGLAAVLASSFYRQ